MAHHRQIAFRPWIDATPKLSLTPSPAVSHTLSSASSLTSSPAVSPMTSISSSPSTSRSSTPTQRSRNSFFIDNLLQPDPPMVARHRRISGSDTESQRSDSVGSREERRPVPTFSDSPLNLTHPAACRLVHPAAFYAAPMALPIHQYSASPVGVIEYHQAVQNLTEQEARAKQARRSRPKKFPCPHPGCPNSFSNRGQLNGHFRIHTGERPFSCEVCQKAFTRNEELTRHKRIHTGIKPFNCANCGKSFGRKDHLKKHVKTHMPKTAMSNAEYLNLYELAIRRGYEQYTQALLPADLLRP